MPGAGHIVHMPAHIYYRVGRYKDSLAANIAAVKADEAYLAQPQADGHLPYGYYPHNVHFVLVSAQMAGDGPTAVEAAGKLDRVISDAIAREVGWVQVIKTAPYFAHAQFSRSRHDPGAAGPRGGVPHRSSGLALRARGRPGGTRATWTGPGGRRRPWPTSRPRATSPC